MTFDAETISGVAGYMNANQPEYNLMLVQCLGDAPKAESATLVNFDEDGADFEAVVDGAVSTLRIPWPHRVESREQVREALFVLVDKALAIYEP